MGDFGIPGAPFVLTLPDDWTVEQSTSSIVASSPQGEVHAVYRLFPASTINEAIESPDSAFFSLFSMLQLELNTMNCVVYHGQVNADIFGSSIWFTHPEGTAGMPAVGGLVDLTVVYVEHQGVVLQIGISMYVQADEFSEHPSLLVMSGVAPSSPLLAPNEEPFSPVSPSDIMSQRAYIPTRPVEHIGTRRTKLSDKKPDFKGLVDFLAEEKPMYWCLNKLEEISEAIEQTPDYVQYSQDLITIREMLKKQWGISDEPEIEVPSIDTKAAQPAPPPLMPSPKETPPADSKEAVFSCSKCGEPLTTGDVFCRNCGTARAAKATRRP